LGQFEMQLMRSKSLLNAEIVTGNRSFVVTSGISFMTRLWREKMTWYLDF